jgi:phage-related minor tail protein
MDETTIKVAVDSSQVGAASKALDEFATAGNKATGTVERMSAAAAKQAGIFKDLAGGSRKNVLSFKDADSAIAALGLTGAAADKLRTQLGLLNQTSAAPKGASGTLSEIGKALDNVSFKSSTARRELLVLASELARGDFHRFGASLLVLAEYSNLSTFATSALGIAVGGLVVALGGMAIAAIQGANEMHELYNALVLTNNAAGLTAGTFDDLSKNVAKNNNLPIGNVREMAKALAETGQVGPQVFQSALSATAKYAELTGVEADKVAAYFAKMADSPTKFLLEINKTTHTFSAAQYETVRALEDAGHSADAQGVIYKALDEQFSGLNRDLGFLGERLRFLKVDWANFWNAAMDIGRPETIEEKIAKTQSALDRVRSTNSTPAANGPNFGLVFGSGSGGSSKERDLQDQRVALSSDQAMALTAANAQAVSAQMHSEGVAARKWGDDLLKHAKDADSLKKALKEAEDKFSKAASDGSPYSDADKARIREVIRRQNTRGRGDEAQQVSRATLAQQLEALAKSVKVEQDQIAFGLKYIDDVFAQGNLSIGDHYAERSKLVRQGVDLELSEIQREKDLIKEALTDKRSPLYEKDPSTRVNLQTKSNKLDQQAADVERKAAQQVVIDNEKAGLSYQQLQERVEAYQVQLLQAAGLEDAAAQVRTNRLVQQASIAAGQSKGTPFALDLNSLRDSLQLQDKLNSLKRQAGFLDTARGIEEENIARLVANGSLTELQSYEKLSQARAQVIPQLEDIVKAQEEIAAKNPLNIQLKLDAAKARLELESLKDSLDPLAKKFQDAFRDQTGNFLFDLMTGKAKPKDAIKNLFNGIGETISKEISTQFSSQLFAKDGVFGGAGDFISKNLFGTKKPEIDTSPVQASLSTLQTTGLDPATTALQNFTSALQNATTTVSNPTGTTAAPGSGPTTGDVSRFDNGGLAPLQAVDVSTPKVANVIAGEQAQAQSAQAVSDANLGAASSAIVLAGAAAKGGSALGLIPQIISAMQAAGIGGKGGPGGFIGSILGGIGGGGASSAAVNTGASFSAETGALFGWAKGGYTGDVDPKKVAGVVHGHEYVFSSKAVDAIGLSTLNRMHAAAANDSIDGVLSAALRVKGNRELGGPVNSGSLYRVNERGPEVLTVDGRQYLMTGGQGGQVTPTTPASGSGGQVIHVHVTPPPGSSRQTALQWGTEAGRHIQTAIRRNR